MVTVTERDEQRGALRHVDAVHVVFASGQVNHEVAGGAGEIQRRPFRWEALDQRRRRRLTATG